MYYNFRQLREQQTMKRGDGGIGRRAGFRCLWWQHRVGSSPILRIRVRYQLIPDFLCSNSNSFLNYFFQDFALYFKSIFSNYHINLNLSFSHLYNTLPFYTNYPSFSYINPISNNRINPISNNCKKEARFPSSLLLFHSS